MRSPTLSLLVLLVAGCSPVAAPMIAPLRPAPPAPPAPLAAEPAPAAPSCERKAPSAVLSPLDPATAGGMLALGRIGEKTLVYIADEDEQAVRTVDLDSGAELAHTPLGATPGQLLITADGRVAVALRSAAGIAVLEPSSDPSKPLERLCAVDAPLEPIGLAQTPDGARVLAASRWGHALTVYEAPGMKRAAEIALPRDPGAVVTSSDGRKAFVSHVTGARMSVVDLDAAAARAVDLHQIEGGMSAGERGSTWSAGQGFSLVRTRSGRILAPEVLASPSAAPDVPSVVVSSGVSSGYGNGGGQPTQIGDVAVLDEGSEKLSRTPVLAHLNQADCLLPRAAALDDESGRLLVACLGEDAVLAYNAKRPLPHLAPLKRWAVASGPTGIAVDGAGRRAVVWAQFARTLSVIRLDEQRVTSFPMPEHGQQREASVELGRMLFHAAGDDRRIAGDKRACASCHPDGRDDGLTWSTPDGPRQTPILAARLGGTAPYSWDGTTPDLESHVRRTFHRLFGWGLAPREFSALLAYVSQMSAPSMPRAAADPRVARGEALFRSADAGCSSCHADAQSNDGERHHVGSRVKGDRTASFDTPSLRFIGRSAPYFHDGRYATLADLLRGVDGTMGRTKHLSAEDLGALEAYLESL